MKRLIKNFSHNPQDPECAICGSYICELSKRRWVPNVYDNKKVIGICFMDEDGNPVEAFDLCDDCSGNLYSRLVY